METEQEQEEQDTQSERNRGGRKQVKLGTTRRNARERNRVRHINACFELLRQHIPHDKHNKKLSKVDTLKSAMIYIANLRQLLNSTREMTSFEREQQSALVVPIEINLKQEDFACWQDKHY